MWSAKKCNMGLTEQVNYKKNSFPVFFYFASLVVPDPTLSSLALSSVSGFTATLISFYFCLADLK